MSNIGKVKRYNVHSIQYFQGNFIKPQRQYRKKRLLRESLNHQQLQKSLRLPISLELVHSPTGMYISFDHLSLPLSSRVVTVSISSVRALASAVPDLSSVAPEISFPSVSGDY